MEDHSMGDTRVLVQAGGVQHVSAERYPEHAVTVCGVLVVNYVAFTEGHPETPTPERRCVRCFPVKLPEFPDVEFYSCTDGERLEYESPEEAIESWVDGWLSPGCDTAKIVHETLPVTTVGCYKRSVIPDKWKVDLVERLLDELDERFADSDFADPDGAPDNEAKTAAAKAMREAVDAYLDKAGVWACEQVAEVELDKEQVEAILRAHCPEWFDLDP